MDARSKSVLDSVDGRPEKYKCMICGRACSQKRRLPCGCFFCKKCLQGYFKRRLHVQEQPTFNCPHCSSDVKCPNRPITEWTKDFKLPHLSTFYPDPVETRNDSEHKSTENGESKSGFKFNGSKFLRAISVSGRGRRQNKPDVVIDNHLIRPSTKSSQDYEFELAFHSNISSDYRTCQYWGGDLLLSDDCVVLADWMNKALKVFDMSGECKTHFQIMVSTYCIHVYVR